MADTAGIKLLVAEDDKFLQKILVTKFAKEGFDVRAASDGEEAVKALLADVPAFMLLDLILPKMNGFEVLAEIRTNQKMKDLPVFILSNLSQEEDIKRAKELGVLDFLVKADNSINQVVEKVKEAYAKYLQQKK